jgi:hypothetical protein
MVRYKATRPSIRILELENRCMGNRTVGSNPSLYRITHERLANVLQPFQNDIRTPAASRATLKPMPTVISSRPMSPALIGKSQLHRERFYLSTDLTVLDECRNHSIGE